MRIAVVSDTHLPRGTRALHPRLLEECAASDLVLHAGDLVRASVLVELEAIGPPVRAVLGNCDDDELARLLPVARTVEADGARIGMVHDGGARVGRGARLAARFPDCDVVVFGHSHIPLVEHEAGILLVNPGSANDRRAQPVCTMALLDVAEGSVEARLVELP